LKGPCPGRGGGPLVDPRPNPGGGQTGGPNRNSILTRGPPEKGDLEWALGQRLFPRSAGWTPSGGVGKAGGGRWLVEASLLGPKKGGPALFPPNPPSKNLVRCLIFLLISGGEKAGGGGWAGKKPAGFCRGKAGPLGGGTLDPGGAPRGAGTFSKGSLGKGEGGAKKGSRERGKALGRFPKRRPRTQSNGGEGNQGGPIPGRPALGGAPGFLPGFGPPGKAKTRPGPIGPGEFNPEGVGDQQAAGRLEGGQFPNCLEGCWPSPTGANRPPPLFFGGA